MEEKPFRVLLDFSEVNARISGLKYVWMHVSPRELNTINDFKQAIIHKFPFFTQENFKLLLRDGLLLETEKVAVLREDDTVKIQLENPCEALMECSAIDNAITVPMAQASHYSLPNNSAVSQNKSRKRKSETFTTSSKEQDNSSANISKKKRKRGKTKCLENEPNNSSHEDLSGVDKDSKSDASQNKDKSIQQSTGKKKKSCPKTPTSDFITFAIKLSEAERMSQNTIQCDVNDGRAEHNITDTHLYKTAELVSKTNLSPIPERSTYLLSRSPTPTLNESLDNNESQVDTQKSPKSGKKRRRKRKRKPIPSNEGVSFSTNASTEIEQSFLADVKSNETYNTSLDARKHIIFRSPSPPKASLSETFDIDLDGSSVEPKLLPNGNNKLKNDSLKNDSQLNIKFDKDCESGIHDVDYNKESTPFSKANLKQKSWGVTPLPKVTSSSTTFSKEKVDVTKTDMKPAYQNCTPLNSLPPVGTRLAYKVLELNQDYCPEITEYKEGILRNVDPNTDELVIELIQEEYKPGKSGKFENLWKDEPLPEDEVVKTVSLNWTSLIDPILIS